MKIAEIYSELYSIYGPQHWWPVTKDNQTSPRYHKNIELNERQKLEICFGAILAQNTNWKNAEKAIINLNKNNLIDIHKIMKINDDRLAKIIKSSGYHNQKAIKLKNFSSFLFKNYSGDLNLFFENNINKLREELLSVNGVGPETADSIMLYAAKKPIFVIDAYAKRIINRIGFKEDTYEDLQELFMGDLEKNEKLFNEYHALLVELGKNNCKKEPLCAKCPVNKMCNHYRTIYLKKIKLKKNNIEV